LQVRRWDVACDDAGEVAASGAVVESFILALPPTLAACDDALRWLATWRDVEDVAVVLHAAGRPPTIVPMPLDMLDAAFTEAGRQMGGDAGADASTEGDEHALIGSPISREDSRDHGDDARRAAVEEALRQLQELLNRPVTEETRARWFAPEILCALVILQDRKPDQFGALCARLRSRRLFSMRDLETALQAHRQECAAGHAPLAPGAKLLKESQATQLVNLVHAAGVELFHDAEGRGYATAKAGSHKETWPVGSKGFESYVRERFHACYGKVPTGLAVRDAVEMLQAEAGMKGVEHRVLVRFAGDDGKVYLDLCNANWEVVEITVEGWRIVTDPPVKFVRAKGMLPLPRPMRGRSVDELRPFVNVASDADFRLIVAFLLGVMMPEGSKPGLAIGGQQGSAKDTLQLVVRGLVDPNKAATRSLPRDTRTLMIAAQNSAILSFGNISHLPHWIADAFCRLMTGAAHAERQNYTDTEETLICVTRAVVFNGIPDLVERGDLADRMIALVLPEIPSDRRRTEGEFWLAFEAARPRILGALCDAVAGALRELPNVRIEKPPRMADFAKWVTAAEKALGWEDGTFLADFQGIREDANAVVLEASPIPPALVTLLVQTGKQTVSDTIGAVFQWHGTATALHAVLLDIVTASGQKQSFPAAPSVLGSDLRRLAPALRDRDICLDFTQAKTPDRTRFVTITGKRTSVLAAWTAQTQTVQQ
jgi:hypothetical protein